LDTGARTESQVRRTIDARIGQNPENLRIQLGELTVRSCIRDLEGLPRHRFWVHGTRGGMVTAVELIVLALLFLH
jgi:hypothetical protein